MTSVAQKLDDSAAESQEPSAKPAKKNGTFRRFLRNPGAMISLTFLVVVAVACSFASFIAPYGPDEVVPGGPLLGPGASYWLGTDSSGRDILTRLLYAGQISLRVMVVVVVLAVVVAVPLGILAGQHGGRIDYYMIRLVEAASSIPPLVLALCITGVLGPGINNVILALSVVMIPGLLRLARGQALAVSTEPFIEASRAIGTPMRRVAVHRILPNVRSALLVQISFLMAAALLAEAGLSYLGLGATPPTATWGNMLREAYDRALFTNPWQLIPPSVVIILTVLALNSVGDGLRDSASSSSRRYRGRRARPSDIGVTSTLLGSTASRRLARKRSEVPGAGDQPVRDAGSSPDPSIAAASRAGWSPAASASAGSSPPASASPVLSVRGLSVEFMAEHGPTRVVDDVSLDLQPGEVLGLVGESGCGKSVTSMAIMRLLTSPPAVISEGRVELLGEEITGLSFAEMRRLRGNQISMIFQDASASLDPAFTVGNLLGEAIKLHQPMSKAALRSRSLELLEMVGIPDPERRLSDYPHQLSGGMRQRVMIASAIACEPRVLIADEPTTALDVTVQAQIIDLLKRLRAELGMSLVFITHDLGVVADICDRAAVMYAGQVIETASVHELFARPRHPYTRALLESMPQAGRPNSRLRAIPGTVPLPAEWSTGCRFEPRCERSTSECGHSPIMLSATPAGLTRCIHPGGTDDAKNVSVVRMSSKDAVT